jgi:hypothetical protein
MRAKESPSGSLPTGHLPREDHLAKRRRRLCEDESDTARHCAPPKRRNVFSRGQVTSDPNLTLVQAPVYDDGGAIKDIVCESDEQGNFGTEPAIGMNSQATRNKETSAEVAFRYQVQTTLDLNVDELNDSALSSLEKALSDRLIPSFFPSSSLRGNDLVRCVDASPQNETEQTLASHTPSRRGERQLYSGLWFSEDNTFAHVSYLKALPGDHIVPGVEGGKSYRNHGFPSRSMKF